MKSRGSGDKQAAAAANAVAVKRLDEGRWRRERERQARKEADKRWKEMTEEKMR